MTGQTSTLVLATTNPGKSAEFRALLSSLLDLSFISLVTPAILGVTIPPVMETGQSFAENARLKASAFASATGLPALADDSGLCVDALGGAPGIHSARWAGEGKSDADRTALLLRELAAVPAEQRTARFVCAAALATPMGDVHLGEGVCEGVLLETPRGTQGFGYDPIFFVPTLGATYAELTAPDKNSISHRALAVRSLRNALTVVLSSAS